MSLVVRFKKRLSASFVLEVDFGVEKTVLGILGPSGCGKSMTLKCIAGVEKPDEGYIAYHGRVFFDSSAGVNLKPQARRVGLLFQNYALFPHLTVSENIGIGISLPPAEKTRRVEEWLARMQLQGMENRLPSRLSGGQQQRAALARMLAASPDLILLDEPFSALDAHLREQMQLEIRGIVREYPEVILVTHDRDEAYRLCDGLLVMESGKVLGRGGCRELFAHPGSKRVAQLTGCKNFSRVQRLGPRRLLAEDWGIELDTAENIGKAVRHVGIRAHDLMPANGVATGDNALEITIQGKTEDPFEWNVIFTNVHAADPMPMWWKFSKYLGTSMPRFLRLPPEALLLLTDP